MTASKIFFLSCAPLLVLACGGSNDPGVGNDAGTSKKGDASSSFSSGSGSNGSSSSNGSASGSGSGSVDNTGSGSSAVKRVFVTSVTYDGNLGGASGADAKCQTAADAQVLGGTWKAWISSGSTNAIDRINDVGPWYLVDGVTKVFNNKANLLTTPANEIDMTESGAVPSWWGYNEVWSGSYQSGDASGSDCEEWTTALGQDATTGSASTDQTWGGEADTIYGCDGPEGLICFEQ
jgi:hypothetical protein